RVPTTASAARLPPTSRLWSSGPWLPGRTPAPSVRRTWGTICSFAPAPVDGVEPALPGLEIERPEIRHQHLVAIALMRLDHFSRHRDRLAQCPGLDLYLAGPLQHVIVEEHRRQSLGHHHRAVVAQHQHA